jgi:hypothetical protein
MKARLTVSALAVATALLVAACGGSSDPGVAHLSSGSGASSASSEGGSSSPESTAGTQQKLVAYAKCMRSHGEPGFPEPVEGRLTLKGSPGSSQNPGSPQFQAAERQCSKLLPNGGAVSPQMRKQAEERARKFASCMRSHGEPNFPEPEFSSGGGGFRIRISGPRSGIDPGSPQFKAARTACRQYFGLPGGKGGRAAGPSGGGEQSGQAVGG